LKETGSLQGMESFCCLYLANFVDWLVRRDMLMIDHDKQLKFSGPHFESIRWSEFHIVVFILRELDPVKSLGMLVWHNHLSYFQRQDVLCVMNEDAI
jgi:hypothetical protein